MRLLFFSAFSLLFLYFTTGQVVTAPIDEDFNDSPWIGAPAQYSWDGIGSLGPGWSRTPDTSSKMAWAVLWGADGNVWAGDRGPSGGAPFFYHNYLALRTRYGLTGTNTATITSPLIDISGLNQPYFQFYYHRNSSTLADLKVEINDGSGWQQVFFSDQRTHFGPDDLYDPFGMSLNAFNDTIQVRFIAQVTGCCTDPMAIDDFRIIEEPTCEHIPELDLQFITDTSALASWTAVSGASSYWVYLKKETEWPYEPRKKYLADTVNTNSVMLTGLDIDECYKYYVRAVCGPSDTGEIRGPYSFCTPQCSHFTTLYYHGLNHWVWPNSCWKSNAFNPYATSGGQYVIRARVNTGWHNDSAKIHSPIIKLASNERIKFSWSRSSYHTEDTLVVYIKEWGKPNWEKLFIQHGNNLEDPTASGFGTHGDFIEESIPIPAKYAQKLVEIVITYKVEELGSPAMYLKTFIVEDSYSTDLAIETAELLDGSECSSSNDTLVFSVKNVLGISYDLATTPLSVTYHISGPIPDTRTVSFNTGTIAPSATETFEITGLDFSETGIYSLDFIEIQASTFNRSVLNDTLQNPQQSKEIKKSLDLQQDTLIVVTNTTDSVELSVSSNFFSSGNFHISEICQWRGGGGSPVGGWPSYITGDDYIEISGEPGTDLAGFQLETWDSTGLKGAITFNSGTVLSPNGTALIGLGSGASTSASDHFYAYYSAGVETVSGTPTGRILKSSNGIIIDAVGYSGSSSYQFPPAAGVSTQEWSGQVPPALSTAGIRLVGPDQDNSANWYSCTDSVQDPNVLNAGVITGNASHAGLSWSLNGQFLSDKDTYLVGPFSSSGLYPYVVEYQAPCGLYRDTAFVLVNLANSNCSAPFNYAENNVQCGEASLAWNGQGTMQLIDYGPTPYIPKGNDTILNTPGLTIKNIHPNTTYEVWGRSICGSDTSSYSTYTFTTANSPLPTAYFTINTGGSSGNYTIHLDGTSSTDAKSWKWYNGSSFMGTGSNFQFTVSSNQPLSLSLVVGNACGRDSATMTLPNISLDEVSRSQSALHIYPNPVDNTLHISLKQQPSEASATTTQLLNASGKVVLSTSESKLDVSNLPSGLYFVRVQNGNRRYIEKVVVY